MDAGGYSLVILKALLADPDSMIKLCLTCDFNPSISEEERMIAPYLRSPAEYFQPWCLGESWSSNPKAFGTSTTALPTPPHEHGGESRN